MDLVVDFLSVTGPDEDIVVTELSVVGAGVLQTYHFDLPTDPYDSPPPVRDGDTGHIPYSALPAILQDAVAGYAHLYSYGRIKCGFLSALVRRTFVDLAELRCPASHELTNNQAVFMRQAVPQILVSGMRGAQRPSLLSVVDASPIHCLWSRVLRRLILLFPPQRDPHKRRGTRA